MRLLCLVWNLTDDSYHFVNTFGNAITVLVSLLNMNRMISYDDLARFGRKFSPTVSKIVNQRTDLWPLISVVHQIWSGYRMKTSRLNIRVLEFEFTYDFVNTLTKYLHINVSLEKDIHSSKTANIILAGLMTKYRWTPLRVQNRIQVQMHPWMLVETTVSPSLNTTTVCDTTSLVHVRVFTYILSWVLAKWHLQF